MTFDLNINVQIGVTPLLATFLTALLQSRPDTPAQLPAIEAPAPEVPAESEKPRRTRRAKADAPEVENPEPEAPAAPEPVEEAPTQPKPFAEAPVQQPDKPLTEEDIRACMHRTRQRFEGEDYKENTTGEGYKKYHKQLTSQFKQIAAILGADKPSALPAEQRAAFIAECDALIIGEDGNITPPSTLLNS
ncbi:hypothetical protein HDR66_00520 [bacterium]|nr:hypothetical protein [bacterium]